MTAEGVFGRGDADELLGEIEVGPDGILLSDAIVQLKFAPSKKEARRLIAQGGVKLGRDTIKDEQYMAHATATTPKVLAVGKKRHGVIIGRL